MLAKGSHGTFDEGEKKRTEDRERAPRFTNRESARRETQEKKFRVGHLQKKRNSAKKSRS